MKKIILIPLMFALAITLNSCDDDDNSSNDSFAYKVRMTDAPGPFTEVNVDIQSVVVTGSNGNDVVLNTEAGIYNLLDYANGQETLLATSVLNDSQVKQIRFVLGSNNSVVLDGVTYPLSTPSAQQSGLKLLVNQTLLADIDNSVLIDFDANSSVVQTGAGTFMLKPVLRTVVAAASGNIEGNIAPIGTLAMVSATSAANIDYTSNVAANGNFKISGLPAGTYTVTVTPLLPLLPVTQTDVVVQAGQSTELGLITFD
jgi:hypothetical protein